MSQADAFAAALAAALPPSLAAAAAPLAALITAMQAQPDATLPAPAPLVADALAALAGRTVPAEGALLQFGAGAQTGDVSVGDVAGNTLVKLHIPVTHHETITQTVQAGDGGTISQVVQISGTGHTIVLGSNNANPAAQHPPADAPGLADGATIFLAGGGTTTPALDALALQLRLRGLRVWREPALGDLTQRAYAKELQSIDAAVIALTPESCESERLLRVELPAIWARFQQPAPFWVAPLIAGVSERTAERTISSGGLRLADMQAFAFDADPARHTTQAADLARLLLREVALPHLRASIRRDGAVELRVFSHLAAGAVGRADLVLDWVERFGSRDAPRWPDPAEWNELLLPALADVRDLVGRSATPRLRIDGRFHLSVGYALGHQFPTTTGVALEVWADAVRQWWGQDRSDPTGAALILEPPQGAPAGRAVSVEVSLTQDARSDAEAYLEEAGLLPIRRVQLVSPPVQAGNMTAARQFVAAPAHALALAEQIADTLLMQKRVELIHLFGPLPQALAVLVGARLNTARPIQCYEYARADGAYVPACLLR